MAQKFKTLNQSDIFVDTSRITTGIFSNGVGTLAGSSMYTSSISASNKLYYYAIQDGDTDTTATKRFDVSYGHYASSGSDLSAGVNASHHETKVIYKQFANILLNDPHGKFYTHHATSSVEASKVYDDDIYILAVDQDVMKDEIDGNFTIALSASFNAGAAGPSGSTLHLTDYSGSSYSTRQGTYRPIVSGSGGTVNDLDITYGNFWPEWGILTLSANQLSKSRVSGPVGNTESGSLGSHTHWGLAPDTRTTVRTKAGTGNYFTAGADNAHKLWRSINAGSVTLRTVQNLNQTIYYCRAFHNEFNWSSNPTYTESGSSTLDIIGAMRGDPVVYATSVGLYNSREELLAIAKLSQPQKKSHSKELVFAVKVDG